MSGDNCAAVVVYDDSELVCGIDGPVPSRDKEPCGVDQDVKMMEATWIWSVHLSTNVHPHPSKCEMVHGHRAR